MAKFCDIEKFKSTYEHKVGVDYDNAICEMEKEEFCVNAIPILESATNGDMVKAMFPYYQIKIGSGQVCLYYSVTEEYDGSWIRFDEEWWNAPYKGVEEWKN